MPTASRMVVGTSMLAANRPSETPDETCPGQRRNRGTCMASVYGNRLSNRPCSDQKNPLSERRKDKVVPPSPRRWSSCITLFTSWSTATRVRSWRRRSWAAWASVCVRPWTTIGLSVRSVSRTEGAGDHGGTFTFLCLRGGEEGVMGSEGVDVQEPGPGIAMLEPAKHPHRPVRDEVGGVLLHLLDRPSRL
jgi:hypothetical protein